MNLLASTRGRRALFAGLYFIEGAPIGFVWWALPAILRERGVPVERVAALSATLVLPWAFKFLWAPAIDLLRGPRFGLRGWIATAQGAMVLFLAPLLWLEPARDIELLSALLLGHACAAATQDAAVDALAISSEREERGSINGWMQAGMLLGRALFGGAVLLLWTGWAARVGALIAVVAGGLALSFVYRSPVPPCAPTRRAGDAARDFGRRLAAAARSPTPWIVLAFAASAGAGFEAAGGLAGALMVDLGAEPDAIGRFFAVPAVVAMALGALAGGRLSDRLGRRAAAAWTGAGVGAAVLGLAAALELGAGPSAAFALLVLVYAGIGLFTATSYALFMDHTDPRLGGTQFSAYMGATNLCESWGVRVAGTLAPRAGYGAAFAVPAAVGLVALALVAAMPRAAERDPAP